MITKIKIIGSILAAAVITSCTKLDLRPTDSIDPTKAFRNISDINMGLLGVYAVLDYSQIALSTYTSDEATYPVENTVGNADAFRWIYTPSSGSVTSFFNTYYQAIDRDNRVLAAMDALNFTGTDEATAGTYRAEALALRGFLHFELLRAYANGYDNGALGVPYMKTAVIGYPARDNFETVIANAKTDLLAARALIRNNNDDRTRITPAAIAAILARIALYEKNWADAIKYASEAIAAIPLDTKAQVPGVWTDGNNAGVIWKLKRVATDSRTGDFFYRQSGGIVLYAPSQKLLNALDATNDVRYSAYIKYDSSRKGNKSPYLVNKYIGGTASAPGMADIKMLRTAEMYLIRAEAEAESTGDAAGDINALRAARINGYVTQNISGKQALIDAVYKERFKELAFEGHRFFDLKRRNMPVERLAADAANANGAVTLLPEAAQYNLPIPAQEMLINKNMVQNKGY